jgi:hypothetical protein
MGSRPSTVSPAGTASFGQFQSIDKAVQIFQWLSMLTVRHRFQQLPPFYVKGILSGASYIKNTTPTVRF